MAIGQLAPPAADNNTTLLVLSHKSKWFATFCRTMQACSALFERHEGRVPHSAHHHKSWSQPPC